MATKYVSALNGQQMDAALTDMAYHTSEAFAIGERNGVPVSSGDVAYQNNAKYYAEQASADATEADAAAARAEAAVPPSTAGAVFFDRAQALTDAQKGQAKANIGAGSTNRNLLDNAYFVGGGSQLGDGVFPINQRGQASYTGNTYTIDRWLIVSSAITVTLNAGYLELSGTAGNNFSQAVSPEIAKGLYGKTVTASALMYDGTIISGTQVFPSVPVSGWNFVDFVYGTDVALIVGTNELARSEFFLQTQSASAKVCAVKLELGTVSTLANDPPPDFGEELRKCQRYLWHKTFPQYTQIGIGVATDASNCVIDVALPASMRTGATIALTASVLLIGAGGAIVAASVSAINIIDNHARLNVVAASSMVAHNTYSFITSAETTMTISAEL